MAEAFGARLLKEIQSEGLEELLSSLSAALPIERNPAVPPIPFLRQLLEDAVEGQSVATEHEAIPPQLDAGLPSSTSPSSSQMLQSNPAADSTKARYVKAPIIEITSAKTNAARTQLIYFTLASLLHQRPRVPASIVIYFDCAYRISVSDLYALLLKSSNNNASVAMEALSRLHIIRPQSSRELLSQIREVESFVWSLPSKNVCIAAIVLADLSVYYWTERVMDEESRLQSSEEGGQKIYSRESLHTMILAEVSRLQKIFKCMVLVSGLGIYSNTDGGLLVKSGLAGPWVRAVDVRIVLETPINGQTQAFIDGRKWIESCEGNTRKGKAKFTMHSAQDSIRLSALNHEP